MLKPEDFELIFNTVHNLPPSFFEELDERQMILWKEYVDTKGELESIGKKIGISTGYVSRLIRVIYAKAQQYERNTQ